MLLLDQCCACQSRLLCSATPQLAWHTACSSTCVVHHICVLLESTVDQGPQGLSGPAARCCYSCPEVQAAPAAAVAAAAAASTTAITHSPVAAVPTLRASSSSWCAGSARNTGLSRTPCRRRCCCCCCSWSCWCSSDSCRRYMLPPPPAAWAFAPPDMATEAGNHCWRG